MSDFASSTALTEPYAGCLLVATPIIANPPFLKAVIFLLNYGPDGAVGVVLNSPSDVSADNYFDEEVTSLLEPPVVFVGGPVEPEIAVAIGAGTGFAFTGGDSLPGVGVVDIDEDLGGLDRLRVFSGYAGWGSRQLEGELLEGAWWVLRGQAEEVFAVDVEAMWERSVARGPGSIPLYRTYPSDPTSN